jgi:hypothetical protein
MAAVLRISLQERNPTGDTFKLHALRQGQESLSELQHPLSADLPAHFDFVIIREKKEDGTALRMISILKENSDLSTQINPALIHFDKPCDITLSNPDGAKEVI